MSIQAQSNEPADQKPANDRPRSARRAIWLIIAAGIVALGLVGLYLGRHPASAGSYRCISGGSPDLVPEAAAIAIFAMTYLVLAIGRLPGFWLDRAGAALVGASLMVAVGVLPLEEVPKAIDFDTIILLLGVMIVVANLRLSGFFRLVNGWVVTRARHPIVLLTAVVLVSGVLSAFLVNDTICLVLTPLVLDLVTRLRRNPVPYLSGDRDGLQHRQHRDDHRQSAEHDHRQPVAHPLRHLCGGIVADCRDRAGPDGRCSLQLVYRSEFWTRSEAPGRAAAGARQSADHHQVRGGLAWPWSRVSLPAWPPRWWPSSRAPSCCSPDGSSPRRSTPRSIGRCC